MFTLYFIDYITKKKPSIKRNNSSFITKVSRNIASKRETIQYRKAKYTNTYYIYNKKSYKITNYKLYNNLYNLDQISYYQNNKYK